MKRVAFGALVMLAAAACSTATTGVPSGTIVYSMSQAADSVPLYPGRQVRVGTLWLTFTGVPSDSRCASDVVCVWAGDAVAEIMADPPCFLDGCRAASMLMALHTTLEPREAEYFGYTVRLVSLKPYPVSTSPIDPASYVAWVRVTN